MMREAKQMFVEALQKAVNHYLSLDTESAERLNAITNKIVKIELRDLNLDFYLKLTPTGLRFDILHDKNVSVNPDTTITGTPLRLLHMVFSKDNRQQFFADDVLIQGNLELGQQVMHLFDQMEIDWEEHLSRLTGDVAAHHVGNVLRSVREWGMNTQQTLLQDINEYVHEEINLFPPSEALHDFFHDVDVLRMDTDRLEARLKRLQKLIL